MRARAAPRAVFGAGAPGCRRGLGALRDELRRQVRCRAGSIRVRLRRQGRGRQGRGRQGVPFGAGTGWGRAVRVLRKGRDPEAPDRGPGGVGPRSRRRRSEAGPRPRRCRTEVTEGPRSGEPAACRPGPQTAGLVTRPVCRPSVCRDRQFGLSAQSARPASDRAGCRPGDPADRTGARASARSGRPAYRTVLRLPRSRALGPVGPVRPALQACGPPERPRAPAERCGRRTAGPDGHGVERGAAEAVPVRPCGGRRGGAMRRGPDAEMSGATGGRTAARTLARRGAGAGGAEPRGEVFVRGHVPEPVSAPDPGQPPPAATPRMLRRPPCPPRAPAPTCPFPRTTPYPPPRPRGRKPWLDFTVPQCGRHAFARIGPCARRRSRVPDVRRRRPTAQGPGPEPGGHGPSRTPPPATRTDPDRPGPTRTAERPAAGRHDRGTCPPPRGDPCDAYGR